MDNLLNVSDGLLVMNHYWPFPLWVILQQLSALLKKTKPFVHCSPNHSLVPNHSGPLNRVSPYNWAIDQTGLDKYIKRMHEVFSGMYTAKIVATYCGQKVYGNKQDQLKMHFSTNLEDNKIYIIF